MKKIIYLLMILMVVMFSICACDTNQDEVRGNNLEINNNKATNQENITNSSNEENSGNNTKETLNEESKESGNKSTEVGDKTEDNSKETISTDKTDTPNSTQSISVSATALSNKINAWGFVRKKNEVRPEFSASYTKVLDDYEGIYAGNSEEKVIYLTFDEGYENGYTSSILDTLKEKDCPATFFVTKPYVKQNQELVQRMIDEGHIVR